jgi:hypothetical protein
MPRKPSTTKRPDDAVRLHGFWAFKSDDQWMLGHNYNCPRHYADMWSGHGTLYGARMAAQARKKEHFKAAQARNVKHSRFWEARYAKAS